MVTAEHKQKGTQHVLPNTTSLLSQEHNLCSCCPYQRDNLDGKASLLSPESRLCACTPAARGLGRGWGEANNWYFQLFQQEIGSARNKTHKMRENSWHGKEVQKLSGQSKWQIFPERPPFDCSTSTYFSSSYFFFFPKELLPTIMQPSLPNLKACLLFPNSGQTKDLLVNASSYTSKVFSNTVTFQYSVIHRLNY